MYASTYLCLHDRALSSVCVFRDFLVPFGTIESKLSNQSHEAFVLLLKANIR
jgi:hypothetical protein